MNAKKKKKKVCYRARSGPRRHNWLYKTRRAASVLSAPRRIKPLLPPARKPPRSEWQILEMYYPRPDVHEEGDKAKYHAEDIDNVVPVPVHLASATGGNAPFFLRLDGAREGLGDRVALERSGLIRDHGRIAIGNGEGVDEAEDEVAGECATKIRHTSEKKKKK